MEDILKIIALWIFSVFAGVMRFLNKAEEEISLKKLLLHGSTALFSGMVVYFLTAEMPFFIAKPLFHAGVIGLAGWFSNETINALGKIYKNRLPKS